MILHVKCVIMVVSKRVEEEKPQLFFVCSLATGMEKEHEYGSMDVVTVAVYLYAKTEKEVSLCGTNERQKEIC